MTKDGVTILIPNNVNRDAEAVVDAIRQALLESGLDDPVEVQIIKPKVKSFGVGDVPQIFLLLSLSPIAWFTKNWIDDYLWPIIKEKIDKPSIELVNWINSLPQKLKDIK
jgi:hypothetical protein